MSGRHALLLSAIVLGVLAQEHYTPIRSELKYVRCELCQATASALHHSTSPPTKGKSLTHEAVGKIIEEICVPEPSKAGSWLLHLDVVKKGDALHFRQQKQQGICRRECKTLSTSCQDLLDSLDDIDELQSELVKRSSEARIKQKLCKDWSKACVTKTPKFTGTRNDEKFMTREEASEERLTKLKQAQRLQQKREQQRERSTQRRPKAPENEVGLFQTLLVSGAAAAAEAIASWRVTAEETWKDYKKYLTYKEAEKLSRRLYKDMRRDLYEKVTLKRVKNTAKWFWRLHQPQALWKNKGMKMAIKILSVVFGGLSIVEVLSLGVSRVATHNKHTGMFVLGASVWFGVACAVGIYFRL